MSLINYINASLEIWGCVISSVVALCLFLSKHPRDLCRRLYLQMLAFNTGALLFDMLALLFRGHVGAFFWVSVRASNFIAFSCNYLLMVTFVHYLTTYLGQRTAVSQTPLRISRIICGVSLALVVLTQFFPIFYTIDAQNIYHRAELFWLSHAMGIACIFLCGWLLLRYRSVLEAQEKAGLWSYILLPLIALSVQMFVYGLMLLYLANTISLVVIFLFLQSEQGRRTAQQEVLLVRQEMELADSRTKIMLSQIQPHFLYNALCVIQDLCHGKAPEAEKATEEFSEFLRSNLDSLSEDKPIFFEQELQHVHNYLSLEQKRFGDDLRVEYDVGPTLFRLPALTLQPIVENAVRYGVMQREDGGTVRISTAEQAGKYLITVKDDGVGFDVHAPKADGRTHIGIDNVRDRLARMCGGMLTIESIPGVGTTAVIMLPRGKEDEDEDSRS